MGVVYSFLGSFLLLFLLLSLDANLFLLYFSAFLSEESLLIPDLYSQDYLLSELDPYITLFFFLYFELLLNDYNLTLPSFLDVPSISTGARN